MNPRYAREFEALFEGHGIDSSLLDYIRDRVYDELPVYTRYDQLGFLAGLSLAEVNKELIRASVAYLERELIRRSSAGDQRACDYLLCMVAIPGWHINDDRGRSVCNDGTMDYLVPYIFMADLRDQLMRSFDLREPYSPPGLQAPDSPSADFVAAALDHSDDYAVYQSPQYDWCPERVYVLIVSQSPMAVRARG